MSRLAFFDTSVFLYADDAHDPEKKRIAIETITRHQRSGTAMVSLQVLQEYYVAATRKLGVEPELAERKVGLMAQMRIVRMDEEDILAAIELHRLHPISFWDALIVHAARLGGAAVLYSEDLQDRRQWPGIGGRGLVVVNPFRAGGEPA